MPLFGGAQLNIMSFLAKRVFEITKVAQAGNAGIPFKKILEEVKFLSLPRAKVKKHKALTQVSARARAPGKNERDYIPDVARWSCVFC